MCFSCLSLCLFPEQTMKKDLKITKKGLQDCFQKEVIWNCSEKRFRIHAKFLKIFVKFQNTGKTLVKFNKNIESVKMKLLSEPINKLLEIIYEVHF